VEPSEAPNSIPDPSPPKKIKKQNQVLSEITKNVKIYITTIFQNSFFKKMQLINMWPMLFF
jgi:hypothetical protein